MFRGMMNNSLGKQLSSGEGDAAAPPSRNPRLSHVARLSINHALKCKSVVSLSLATPASHSPSVPGQLSTEKTLNHPDPLRSNPIVRSPYNLAPEVKRLEIGRKAFESFFSVPDLNVLGLFLAEAEDSRHKSTVAENGSSKSTTTDMKLADTAASSTMEGQDLAINLAALPYSNRPVVNEDWSYVKEYLNLRKTDEQLTATIASKQAALLTMQADLSSVKIEMVSKQVELITMQTEITSKQVEFHTFQTELTSTQTEILAKQAEFADLNKQIATTKTRLADHTQQLARAVTLSATAASNLGRAIIQTQQAEIARDTALEDTERTNRVRDRLLANYRLLRAHHAHLQADHGTLTADFQALNAEIDIAEEMRDHIEAQNRVAYGTLNDINAFQDRIGDH